MWGYEGPQPSLEPVRDKASARPTVFCVRPIGVLFQTKIGSLLMAQTLDFIVNACAAKMKQNLQLRYV